MFRIIESRGTGKTGRLMLLAKENNGILVCANPHAMLEKAIAYGLVGFDIISYYDYINDQYDTNKPCYIDELELFVKRAFKGELDGYSISLE